MAQEIILPTPGMMVHLSLPENPPVLKGVTVYPDNPFKFDFILDRGQSNLSNDELKEESKKLVKYFLSSITTPEKDLWVNLSPYEKNRIVPKSFGQTDMGRDLLAEDYILKQITASLIYPESKIGKEFWKRVYEEAQKKYNTTDVPVNTFNKVWIVPDHAKVYEHGNTAFVVRARLKVMLEQDYLAIQKNQRQPGDMTLVVSPSTLPNDAVLNTKASQGNNLSTSELGSQIVREIVIPQLEKEVNEGKNFAPLRQVYYSLILAVWFKKKMKDSILGHKYMDQNKDAGIKRTINDTELIYQRYLKAFKKGVYNYIKEEPDPMTQEMIPRKYFSGGFQGSFAMNSIDYAQAITPIEAQLPDAAELTVNLSSTLPPQSARPTGSHAMISQDRLLNADIWTDPQKQIFAEKFTELCKAITGTISREAQNKFQEHEGPELDAAIYFSRALSVELNYMIGNLFGFKEGDILILHATGSRKSVDIQSATDSQGHPVTQITLFNIPIASISYLKQTDELKKELLLKESDVEIIRTRLIEKFNKEDYYRNLIQKNLIVSASTKDQHLLSIPRNVFNSFKGDLVAAVNSYVNDPKRIENFSRLQNSLRYFFVPLEQHREFLKGLGQKAQLNGPVVFNPYGGFSPYQPFALVDGATDVVSQGSDEWGSVEDMMSLIKNSYFHNYSGMDSQFDFDALKSELEVKGLGGLAIQKIIMFLNGNIKGLYYFGLNEDGSLQFSNERSYDPAKYKNCVVEFEVTNGDGRKILKRYWYIQQFVEQKNVGYDNFLKRFNFQTMIMLGAPDTLWSREYRKLSIARVLAPAKENKARVFTDRDLGGGVGIASNRQPIWKWRKFFSVHSYTLPPRYSLGYSHPGESVYWGKAEDLADNAQLSFPASQAMNAIQANSSSASGNRAMTLEDFIFDLNTWFQDYQFIDRKIFRGQPDHKYTVMLRLTGNLKKYKKENISLKKGPEFGEPGVTPVFVFGVSIHITTNRQLSPLIRLMNDNIDAIVRIGQKRNTKKYFLEQLKKKIETVVLEKALKPVIVRKTVPATKSGDPSTWKVGDRVQDRNSTYETEVRGNIQLNMGTHYEGRIDIDGNLYPYHVANNKFLWIARNSGASKSQIAQTPSAAMLTDAEWGGLMKYHLNVINDPTATSRLQTIDIVISEIRRRAAVRNVDGMRESAIAEFMKLYQGSTDDNLRAKLLKGLLVLGFQNPDIYNMVQQVFLPATIDATTAAELIEGVGQISDALSEVQYISWLKIIEHYILSREVSHDTIDEALWLFTGYSRREVIVREFKADHRLIEWLKIPTAVDINFFLSNELLGILTGQSQKFSPEQVTALSILQLAVDLPEVKNIPDELRHKLHFPHDIIGGFFAQGARVVALTLPDRELSSMELLKPTLLRMIHEDGVTQIALPFAESERKRVEQIMDGSLNLAQWQVELAGTKNGFLGGLIPDEYRESDRLNGLVQSLRNTLVPLRQTLREVTGNPHADFIYFDQSLKDANGAEEGEPGLIYQAAPILNALDTNPHSRVVVIGDFFNLAKQNQKVDETFHSLSLMEFLSKGFGENGPKLFKTIYGTTEGSNIAREVVKHFNLTEPFGFFVEGSGLEHEQLMENTLSETADAFVVWHIPPRRVTWGEIVDGLGGEDDSRIPEKDRAMSNFNNPLLLKWVQDLSKQKVSEESTPEKDQRILSRIQKLMDDKEKGRLPDAGRRSDIEDFKTDYMFAQASDLAAHLGLERFISERVINEKEAWRAVNKEFKGDPVYGQIPKLLKGMLNSNGYQYLPAELADAILNHVWLYHIYNTNTFPHSLFAADAHFSYYREFMSPAGKRITKVMFLNRTEQSGLAMTEFFFVDEVYMGYGHANLMSSGDQFLAKNRLNTVQLSYFIFPEKRDLGLAKIIFIERMKEFSSLLPNGGDFEINADQFNQDIAALFLYAPLGFRPKDTTQEGEMKEYFKAFRDKEITRDNFSAKVDPVTGKYRALFSATLVKSVSPAMTSPVKILEKGIRQLHPELKIKEVPFKSLFIVRGKDLIFNRISGLALFANPRVILKFEFPDNISDEQVNKALKAISSRARDQRKFTLWAEDWTWGDILNKLLEHAFVYGNRFKTSLPIYVYLDRSKGLLEVFDMGDKAGLRADPTIDLRIKNFPRVSYAHVALKGGMMAKIEAGAPSAGSLAMNAAPGGIDLSAKNMNLEVDKDKGMSSQPMDLKVLENIEINGLYIKDIELKPLKNLPELLGVSAS